METSTEDWGQLGFGNSFSEKNRLGKKWRRRNNFSSNKMHLLLWNIGILGILTAQVLCWRKQYDGDQVLRVAPQNMEQVQCLQDLCKSWLLDLWKPLQPEYIHVMTVVYVRIPSTALQPMKENLLHCSLTFEILIDNVQDTMDSKTRGRRGRSKRPLAEYDYTKYHSMEEIYHWINQMSESNSQLVTQHFLGATYELRPMHYLKISQPSHNPKKIVWMDCGIHAREWITPAFCQWFVKEIVQNHQTNPQISKILQNIDLYVLPVFNIDGYVYTWTTDRLWRKSRSQHENGTCFGVDLNRNFNAKWGTASSSMNCSSSFFCGNSPVSEPETRAVVHFVESRKSDIVCFLTIHSYSQCILTAYGYTAELARNYNERLKVAQMAASAMKIKHGSDYRVGPFSKLLYEASGTSQDWAHDLGIDFSFSLELRDNGTYKFTLPEDQIRPTCEETMAGAMKIIEYVNDKYFPNKAPTTSVIPWLSVLLSYVVLGMV